MSYATAGYNSTLGSLASGAAGGAAAGGPIGAAIGAGGALASAALGNKGAKRAAQAQEKASREAMAYQREQDAKEEARYREQEAALKAQWEANEARLAPYRQAAEALLGQNADRLGLPFTPSTQARTMPAGWTPGQKPRTLASLAGTGYVPPTTEGSPIEAPKLTLNDILNTRWGAERRVS